MKAETIFQCIRIRKTTESVYIAVGSSDGYLRRFHCRTMYLGGETRKAELVAVGTDGLLQYAVGTRDKTAGMSRHGKEEQVRGTIVKAIVHIRKMAFIIVTVQCHVKIVQIISIIGLVT